MPTPPRRRPAAPSTRRPKVAGLRKPGHVSAPRERADTEQASPAIEPERAPESTVTRGPSTVSPTLVEPDTSADTDVEVAADTEIVSEPVIGAEPEPEDTEPEDTEPAPPRTRPTGKRRSTGRPVPDEPDNDDRAEPVGGRPLRLNLAIGLAIAALVLGGLAVWFKGETDSLAAGTDDTNIAFTDSAATSEVKGQLTAAVERTLSYNFADLDATANEVRQKLTGKAECEYNALFGKHKEEATAQKLVVTTKVRQLGLNRLQGDQAYVLVFVDQTGNRTDKNETTGSRAQFGVRGERVDGAWKIAGFDMLGQPLPPGAALPNC
ncbi:MAG: hypothetical protein M3548_02635 [Actinomycetota bacterium]|nr:hypothetical protein [Actinomycetota bacterium]